MSENVQDILTEVATWPKHKREELLLTLIGDRSVVLNIDIELGEGFKGFDLSQPVLDWPCKRMRTRVVDDEVALVSGCIFKGGGLPQGFRDE